MSRLGTAMAALALASIVAACGGGGSKNATPAATATKAPAAPFTADRAKLLIQSVPLSPSDLADPGWKISSDSTQDNAAAATADPTMAASNERCGRLIGRILTTMPPNVVSSFIGGETVSYFTQLTVYATEAGAADCAAEAATKLQQPGQLARAFGGLFIAPDSVVVTPVEYPATADGSFAVTLSGQISAAGFTVDLTLLVVAFRKGNVTAVVGSARNGTPPVSELTPLVELVLKRIATAQE